MKTSLSLFLLAAICTVAKAQTPVSNGTTPPRNVPIPLGSSEVSAPLSEAELPKVLLIGDSIAGYYAPYVQREMANRAKVVVVQRKAKKPDGSTVNAMEEMDEWLASDNWAVIHFNWGLWDIVGVAGSKTGENRVPIEKYGSNLRALVAKMKNTGASLVFATTTPVPSPDVDSHRKPADVILYNAVAVKIMEESQIHVDDLYSLALPRLAEIQFPSNVHFFEKGSQYLGKRVVGAIDFMLYLRDQETKKKRATESKTGTK